MITALHVPQSAASSPTGNMRPINLRTDLAQLADLIELVFADTMDAGGRAAIREMRAISRMGAGLSVLGRMNELALGINLGYVWMDGERLVGNVSLYPANWHRSLGKAWIIANVAVHPDYRRRGIARHLMEATLQLVHNRYGKHAILQVDVDNEKAIALYEDLGFMRERAFTTWTRNSLAPPPRDDRHKLFITRRRPSEWRDEYAMVSALRPAEQGGIGWLKPLHESLFRRNIWQQMGDWLSFGGIERLIVRNRDDQSIAASLWIDNPFASLRVNFHLFSPPDNVHNEAAALLNNALRRFRTSNIVLEHPADDLPVNTLLEQYRFKPHRTVWHMRRDF